MKQTVRSFALGLLTASIIILLGLFIFKDSEEQIIANADTEDMIEVLKEDGFRVLTESEYISMSVQHDEARTKENEKKKAEHTKKRQEIKGESAENKDDKDDKDEAAKDEKKENEEKKDKIVKIKVESGTPSSKISDQLEKEGLIDDARKFDKYLEEHNYVKYIQLGEHEVKQGMSQAEIAKALTK